MDTQLVLYSYYPNWVASLFTRWTSVHRIVYASPMDTRYYLYNSQDQMHNRLISSNCSFFCMSNKISNKVRQCPSLLQFCSLLTSGKSLMQILVVTRTWNGVEHLLTIYPYIQNKGFSQPHWGIFVQKWNTSKNCKPLRKCSQLSGVTLLSIAPVKRARWPL